MSETIRVGLVEDQKLFREGMKSILSSYSGIEVVFESPDGYSVIERLDACKNLPHVLLVDLSLPPKDGQPYDGTSVTDDVFSDFPDIKIIILSVHDDENFIAELIERGAHGYLVKESDPEEVIEAIRSAHIRGSYINRKTLMAIQNRMANKKRGYKSKRHLDKTLTKREIEVLRLVCDQLTTEQIAEQLFISTKTVDGHRNNLLQKTGSRNVAGLVLYALKKQIIML